MPLRDHFRRPWSDHNPWEGFHSAWVNTIVRHLNGSLLPRHMRAFPQVHLGPYIEADTATFESVGGGGGTSSPTNGGLLWSPPEAVQTLEVEWPGEEVYEVRITDERPGSPRLVAVVELVSPGNKDRPEERQAFAAKCVSYLQGGVGVVVVDIVTTRRSSLHARLLEMFGLAPERPSPHLYAVSYRPRRVGEEWRLDVWPFTLAVGAVLPTVPMWAGAMPIRLDLEASYEETCAVLRIE